MINLTKRRSLLLAMLGAGLTACTEQRSTSNGAFSGASSPQLSTDFPKWSPRSESPASAASGASEPVDVLNSSVPPPPAQPFDPAPLDEIGQLKSRLYDHRSLIAQSGQNLFTSKRVEQSLLYHLSLIPIVEDRPKPRRLELRALSAASSAELQPLQIAQDLEGLLSPDDIRRFRGTADIRNLSIFNALLGATVYRSTESLATEVAQSLRLSDWRRSAVAWLTTATRSELVERHIATESMPYVISHLGLDPRKRLPSNAELIQRADALAFARVHLATAEMTDLDVYAVIRNFEITGISWLYEFLFRAYINRNNAYLTAFHNEIVQLQATPRRR